jgi:hypothetical protein
VPPLELPPLLPAELPPAELPPAELPPAELLPLELLPLELLPLELLPLELFPDELPQLVTLAGPPSPQQGVPSQVVLEGTTGKVTAGATIVVLVAPASGPAGGDAVY